MKKLALSLLTLAAFAADAPAPKSAPTPDPAILAEYFHAQWLVSQAASPCTSALVEPNKAVAEAVAKLRADAANKGADIKDGPNQTVIYVPKPKEETKK